MQCVRNQTVCAVWQIKTERITNENKLEWKMKKQKTKMKRKSKKQSGEFVSLPFFSLGLFVFSVLFEMSTRNERESAYTNSLIDIVSPFSFVVRAKRHTCMGLHTIRFDTVWVETNRHTLYRIAHNMRTVVLGLRVSVPTTTAMCYDGRVDDGGGSDHYGDDDKRKM